MPNLIPKTIEPHIGIEIECIVTEHQSQIGQKIGQLGLRDIITNGTDSSVYTDEGINETPRVLWNSLTREYAPNPKYTPQRRGTCVEFRFISPLSTLKDNLKKIAELFDILKPYINKSCGLHVHLDMRNFPVDNAARNLYAKQRDLFRAVDSERLENEFAEPAYSGLEVRKRIDERNTDHYHAISLDSYPDLKTIEVRICHGTVDCREIYEWAKLLSEIAYKGKLTKTSQKVLDERIARYGKAGSIPNIIYNPLTGLYINETRKKAKRA